MSTMRGYAKLYMAMAMSGLFMGEMPFAEKDTGKPLSDFTDEDKRALLERINSERKRQLLKKGCSEFNFGEVTIIALNEKNVQRKYDNYKNKLKSM